MVQTLSATKRPPRHGEWTRAKMGLFLRELAASQSVAHAARSVGMGRQSAYKLRRRLAGTALDEAWGLALEPMPAPRADSPLATCRPRALTA